MTVREESLTAGVISLSALPLTISAQYSVCRNFFLPFLVLITFHYVHPASNSVHAGAWQCVSSAGIDGLGLVGDSDFRTVLEGHSGDGTSMERILLIKDVHLSQETEKET